MQSLLPLINVWKCFLPRNYNIIDSLLYFLQFFLTSYDQLRENMFPIHIVGLSCREISMSRMLLTLPLLTFFSWIRLRLESKVEFYEKVMQL